MLAAFFVFGMVYEDLMEETVCAGGDGAHSRLSLPW